jgi:tetratricopeptide (TPR) repeat protein
MWSGLRPSFGLLMIPLLAGCRLPGMDGPVSRSLASSRQMCQQGVAALERGQWEEAETVLSHAVSICPGNPDARRNYADALWNRGSRREAIAQLEQAQRLAPENATLCVRMAEMRLALGQTDPAMDSAQRAIDLDPRLADAWAARARVMRAVNRPADALADYQRALGYQPQDRTIPLEMAEVYGQINQPQRALATLQGLAERYPTGEEPQRVLYLEGLTQMALGRFPEAAESLSAAAAREKPTPELLYRLAEARMSAGYREEAAAAAREALALDPRHQPSQQLLQRVELAGQPRGLATR